MALWLPQSSTPGQTKSCGRSGINVSALYAVTQPRGLGCSPQSLGPHGPQSLRWPQPWPWPGRRSAQPCSLPAVSGSAEYSIRRGRHPELMRVAHPVGGDSGGGAERQGCDSGPRPETTSESGSAAVTAAEAERPRPEELDERYRRADYSEVFQFDSRKAFARCIAGGEPRMRLAEAALHVTAEDDAIASHSTVPFPVPAWLDRIDRLVDQLAATHMRRAAAAVSAPAARTSRLTATHVAAAAAAGGGAAAETEAEARAASEAAAALRVVERFLFEECGFRMPDYGRSNLPARSVVDHAGVWEDARMGYLHETLIRRIGSPASLGLMLGEVCNRLLARGVLSCAAAIDTRDFMMLPRAVPLPHLTREALLVPGSVYEGSTQPAASAPGGDTPVVGVGLNTCTSEVLVEMLRHLKRSYWPFPWDTSVDASYPGAVGSHGGFRSAAKAAMGDEMSAVLAAISKVAAWRLERGIWTSPGAGDIRRARAACERLVLLAGERCPEERRDLAVLLIHCGELGAARLELRTYLQAVSDPTNPGPSRAWGLALATNPVSPGDVGPDPFDLTLCRRLMGILDGLVSSAGLEPGTALAEPAEPLGVQAALRAVPPWEGEVTGERRYMPLTW